MPLSIPSVAPPFTPSHLPSGAKKECSFRGWVKAKDGYEVSSHTSFHTSPSHHRTPLHSRGDFRFLLRAHAHFHPFSQTHTPPLTPPTFLHPPFTSPFTQSRLPSHSTLMVISAFCYERTHTSLHTSLYTIKHQHPHHLPSHSIEPSIPPPTPPYLHSSLHKLKVISAFCYERTRVDDNAAPSGGGDGGESAGCGIASAPCKW